MKNLIYSLLILTAISCAKSEQNYKIMTYNIRYDNPNDGENQWSKRKDFLSNQIAFFAPDIFGIQEGLRNQIKDLDVVFSDYKYVGVGRDDGKKKGEYCAIFYNSNKLEILENNTFWLSETPNKTSVGWDADLERICTYGKFKNKENGDLFWVFNTHFDHIGVQARIMSSELILKKINELNKNNLPVLLMGDLNLLPNSEPIQNFSKNMNDSKAISSAHPFGSNGTYNGFEFCKSVTERIDYIFTSKNNISVSKYAVLTDSKDQKYPSDHFPVIVEIKISPF